MELEMKINLKWFDEETGDEIEHEFPAKNEVCPRCEGFGTHLNPSIGEHAYTIEEFNEAFFEDEDKDAYFSRGGIYDGQCQEGRGNKVVLIADEERFNEEEKKLFEQYEESEEKRARYDAEDRMTQFWENGGRY